MVRIDVPIEFRGTVTVEVPAVLCERDPKAARELARNFALARCIVTHDNPDSPDEEALEATQDYYPAVSEEDWDATKIITTGGTWSAS